MRQPLPPFLSRAEAEDAEQPVLQQCLWVGQCCAEAVDAELQAWRQWLLVGPSLVLREDAAAPLRPDVAEDGVLQQADAADVLVGRADRVAAASGESVVIECLKKRLVNLKCSWKSRGNDI